MEDKHGLEEHFSLCGPSSRFLVSSVALVYETTISITWFHLSKGLSGNHPCTLCDISFSDLRHYLSLISIFLNSEKGRLGQSQEGGDIPVAFRRPGTLVWNAGLGSSQQQGI